MSLTPSDWAWTFMNVRDYQLYLLYPHIIQLKEAILNQIMEFENMDTETYS